MHTGMAMWRGHGPGRIAGCTCGRQCGAGRRGLERLHEVYVWPRASPARWPRWKPASLRTVATAANASAEESPSAKSVQRRRPGAAPRRATRTVATARDGRTRRALLGANATRQGPVSRTIGKACGNGHEVAAKWHRFPGPAVPKWRPDARQGAHRNE